MHTLPVELSQLIVEFKPFFSKSVWENAQTLLVGALLAIGKRALTKTEARPVRQAQETASDLR